MTFANFQSQNNQNNDGNNVMKQIGQHISQHLFQQSFQPQNMSTSESFGPAAFGSPSSMNVNQSLQSSQNNQQESKNIFN